MDNQTDYYLLLADLKDSTRLDAGPATAAKDIVLDQLSRMNEAHAASIVSPLELNYGDEFAGLFRKAAPIYPVVRTIGEALKPYAGFRFAVAYGRIGYAKGPLTQMGGPVFEVASDTLKQLKKGQNVAEWRLSDPLRSRVLTTMTNAVHALVSEMTDYRYDVYRLFRSGLSGVDVAEQLRKDKRSVSSAKIAGHADLVIELESTLMAVLDEEDGLHDT